MPSPIPVHLITFPKQPLKISKRMLGVHAAVAVSAPAPASVIPVPASVPVPVPMPPTKEAKVPDKQASEMKMTDMKPVGDDEEKKMMRRKEKERCARDTRNK